MKAARFTRSCHCSSQSISICTRSCRYIKADKAALVVSQSSSIPIVPDIVTALCMCYLPVRDQARATQVNRNWLQVIRTHPLLFQHLTLNLACGSAIQSADSLLYLGAGRVRTLELVSNGCTHYFAAFDAECAWRCMDAMVASIVKHCPRIVRVNLSSVHFLFFPVLHKLLDIPCKHIFAQHDSRCCAVWDAGSKLYLARILSLNQDGRTYVVEYSDGDIDNQCPGSFLVPLSAFSGDGQLTHRCLRDVATRRIHFDGEHCSGTCTQCLQTDQWIRSCANCAQTQCTTCRASLPSDRWLAHCPSFHYRCRACHWDTACKKCV